MIVGGDEVEGPTSMVDGLSQITKGERESGTMCGDGSCQTAESILIRHDHCRRVQPQFRSAQVPLDVFEVTGRQQRSGVNIAEHGSVTQQFLWN